MKKVLATVLVLVMLFCCAAVHAEGLRVAIYSGRIGKFTWAFFNEEGEGELQFRGTGEMVAEDPIPWEICATQVKRVIFADGITGIPDNFLAGCVNMSEIYFPANITYIGSGVLSVSGKISMIHTSGEIDTLLNAMQDEKDKKVLNTLGVRNATYADGVIILEDGTRIVTEYFSDENGEKYKRETYYDEEGNVTKQKIYDSKGNIMSVIDGFDDDESEFLHQKVFFFEIEEGKTVTYIDYYDIDDTSHEVLLKSTRVADGESYTEEYAYDDQGNRRIVRAYLYTGTVYDEEWEITINGRKTGQCNYTYDDDGNEESEFFIFYDENGKRISAQRENADGSKAVASYSDDKLAQVHYYNADGSETIIDYVPGVKACRRYEQKNADGSGYIAIYDTATNTMKTYTQVGVPGDDGSRINEVYDYATLTLLSVEEEYADGSKVITYYDSNQNITGYAIAGIPDANGVAHYTFYDQNGQATGEEGDYDNCGNVVLLDVDTEMSLSEAAPCVEEDLTLEAEIWPMPMEDETAEEEPVAEEPVEYEAEEEPVEYEAEEEPVADEPATEEEPVAEEESATEEEPVAEEEPATEEEPVANDEPATEEEPVAEEEPATEEEPVAEEEPAGEEDAA